MTEQQSERQGGQQLPPAEQVLHMSAFYSTSQAPDLVLD
jgi:hypothetical protein